MAALGSDPGLPDGAAGAAPVRAVELVAGVPSHAEDSNGLGRHVWSSWVRAFDRAGLSLIGRHRAGPSCAIRQSGHQQPCLWASRRPCLMLGSLPCISASSSSARNAGSREMAAATFWVVSPKRFVTPANLDPDRAPLRSSGQTAVTDPRSLSMLRRSSSLQGGWGRVPLRTQASTMWGSMWRNWAATVAVLSLLGAAGTAIGAA
jgi:hypothetical protein